ncbi:MAG TPA: DUF2231 domain-containing protein [Polyangia bacterium]|jgi:uncharacterized membrane protein
MRGAVLVAALLALGPVAAWAQGAGRPASQPASGPGVGGVEEIGNVQVFAPGEEGQAAGPQGAGDLLGRLHPALVHFPIAWLCLLLLVEVVGVRREAWHRAGMWVLVATLLSCLVAIPTGLLRADHLQEGAPAQRFVLLHRNLNLGMALALLAALAVRVMGGPRAWARWGYLMLVLAATALILVAANVGGKMVYGANYLPF